MMVKVVLKLGLHDNDGKRKTMQTVASLPGIDWISMDMKEMNLTVVGDVDPTDLANQLRKHCHTEILSVAPAMEENKNKPKKEEPEKTSEDLPEKGEKYSRRRSGRRRLQQW